MQSFNLKILTSDGVKFDGQAESVVVRTQEGNVAILARHIDYVTALGIGIATVTVNGVKKYAACNKGVLSVMKGQVSILASTFEWADEIDTVRVERALAKGKEDLAKSTEARDIELAKRRISRALTRKSVAETL